jgi:predicted nucleotidyltransferase
MVAPVNPGAILFGSTRRAILSLTFLRPDESFYLREIVRRTGCGAGSVQRELKLLTASGILRRDRQRFFQANRDCPIYEALKQIVIRTVGLGERLGDRLRPVEDLIAIALIFGSFARGEPHDRSDVDLLVIAKDNRLSAERINELLEHEQEQLGREINPFVLTAREWRLKLRTGNAFVRRLLDGEKVYLIGDDDELKRLAEKRMAQAASAGEAGNHRPSRAGGPGSQKRQGKGTRQ